MSIVYMKQIVRPHGNIIPSFTVIGKSDGRYHTCCSLVMQHNVLLLSRNKRMMIGYRKHMVKSIHLMDILTMVVSLKQINTNVANSSILILLNKY